MARARGQRRNDDDDQGDEEERLTRDDVIGIVNAAVTDHAKRKMPSIIASALNAALDRRERQLTDSADRAEPDDEPDDRLDPDEQPDERRRQGRAGRSADRASDRRRQDREADRGDQDRDRRDRERPARVERDPAVAKMQQKLDKLERERQTEREQARSAKRDELLRDRLAAAGVDKNRIRGAVAVLRDSTRYDERADEWVFVERRDGVDEELDFEMGVRNWAATDEGKSYLAPPGQGGAGTGGAPQLRRSGAGTRTTGGQRGSASPAADARSAKAAKQAEAQQQLAAAVDQLVTGSVTLG